MITGFKPLLAVEADLDKIKYPVAISTKLDGLRSIVIDGVVMSRKLKPIPNKFVQERFGRFEGYDGELILGDPTADDVFRKTTSAVMSIEGEPDVRFYVFDNILVDAPWVDRYTSIKHLGEYCVKHPHKLVHDREAFDAFHENAVSLGYEGTMVRSLRGWYKFGRSTVKEGILLKRKDFADAEFKVIGYEERQHNGNEATVDELGHTKRSTHQANKTGRGDLGALLLEGAGFSFSCGTGFTDEQRAELWEQREALIGRWAKVKYFAVGVKEAPRFPVFLGFRDEGDM